MTADRLIPILLVTAWLVPLVGAAVTWIAGHYFLPRTSRGSALIATSAIGLSVILSLWAGLLGWRKGAALPLSDVLYDIARFGTLHVAVDYHIDSLTLLMFGMVTLIAFCIHLFGLGYLADEQTEAYHDHEVEDHVANSSAAAALHADEDSDDPQYGHPADHADAHAGFIRPGRLHRFYAFLQFFCFSMLGLVLAGNVWEIFAFWELVGASSYFLIGFYFERSYAGRAAAKAFIMNRIGDAGFLIGMMALWTVCGTLTLHARTGAATGAVELGATEIVASMSQEIQAEGESTPGEAVGQANTPPRVPRWWLVVAGLGLFAGCVGKSAQLPLSTWLPDAMAGPTPVSALVHSATMVAAGVYLLGRIFPLLLPDVLLVIAYVGMATLFFGATCAMVQTDLKRILAYSTISQLGYMMLAMGVGGRDAGLFHLVTHAFFKSLLFLSAGSVIVACHHVQDLRRLGGLRRRMPVTAWTSLIGVIAIGGLAIPMIEPLGQAIAFSGYHSKDSILAAALAFVRLHPVHGALFAVPLVTAGLTAFYMFRFWLLTFAGESRDELLTRHVRERSWAMKTPLIVLAAFAALVAVGGTEGPLFRTIEASEVTDLAPAAWPHEAWIDAHHDASLWGLLAAAVGGLTALLVYAVGLLEPRRAAEFIGPLRSFFTDGWLLDRLYRHLVVTPTKLLAFAITLVDRFLIDGLVKGVTYTTKAAARFDRAFDEQVVDGLVTHLADVTYRFGSGMRRVQTGRIRQYVLAIGVTVVALFALMIILFPRQ